MQRGTYLICSHSDFKSGSSDDFINRQNINNADTASVLIRGLGKYKCNLLQRISALNWVKIICHKFYLCFSEACWWSGKLLRQKNASCCQSVCSCISAAILATGFWRHSVLKVI